MNIINHIVYADDDDDDITFFREAINVVCPSVKLTTAQNGRHLLNVLDNNSKPDLILIDLNMPILSGYECLVELRNNNNYHDTPIVVYTTSNNYLEVKKCMKAGATNYLVKPESFSKLQALVKALHLGNIKSTFQHVF